MSKNLADCWESLQEEAIRARMKRQRASQSGSKDKPKGGNSRGGKQGSSRCVYPDDFGDLPGDIFMTGNKVLDIPREKALRHPCAVIETDENPDFPIILSKGTSASNIKERYLHQYIFIDPDGTNNLSTRTAFDTYVRRISHRFLFISDCIGKLSEQDFSKLIEAIRRRDSHHATL